MVWHRGVRGIVGSVVAALLGLAVAGAPVASAEPRGLGTERPIGPAPVYAGLAHGNIVMASNSVVTCQRPPCSESASNASPVVAVKTDPNAPGRTASAATLTLPAGAKVLNARLYWQLNAIASNGTSGDTATANQVSIKQPGASGYTRLTADTYDWFDALGSSNITAHAGAKDVTQLVAAAGSGSYTVADIQACTGQSISGSNLGCWGGWSLVVAYENDPDPLRYLQVWDGFMRVRGGNTPTSATINLTGIKTVASRTPNVTMGITAGDGDANIDGDYLEVGPNASSLQLLNLPAPSGVTDSNAFSSRIDTVTTTGSGTNLTSRDPSPVNNMGYDARTVDITGKLPAGATTMQVKIGTTGDALYPQVVWLTSDALEPDLQIVKANDPVGNTDDNPPGYVRKGDQVTYSFDVANKHPDGSTKDLDTATDVVLTDTLPTGVSYVAGSNSNCSAAGQKVTCTLPDLAPGASTKVIFKVTVGATVPDGTKLDNTAGLDFKGKLTGRLQHRDSNTVRNTVTSPGYELIKKVDKASSVPGDTLTYTVTLRNTGKIPVDGVTVRDALPPNTVYQSATATQGTTTGTGPIDWAAGTLAVGGTATMTIKVTVQEAAIGQTLINRASVPTGPPPTIPPDVRCPDDPAATCATTVVPNPTYTVEKTSKPASANPGDPVTYTLTVTNTGRVTAANLVVTDDLTAVLDDADYQNDASATAGSVTYAAPKLTWKGSLAAGASATVTYTVKVKNPDTGDHLLTNVVTSETPGGNCPPGSTDPKCTTTTPVSGLVIEKSVDKQSANPGDTVKYTVTVRNTGKTNLTAATFTDDLTKVLDDADYQNDGSASPGSVSYAAPKLTWTGDLEVGATATVTYTFTVKDPNPGDHLLTNVVSSETPGNNCPPGSTDPKCTTTTPVSGLVIEKSSDKQSANPGDTVKYTVTVRNTGQTKLTAATFTDDLTKVLDDADYQNDGSASTGSVSYAEPKLTWIGDLELGATATVTYTVKVKNPNPGDHLLTNVVSSETPGNNCPPGSTDPKCTTTTPVSGLEIEKVVDKQSANPGDTVKYTVTVRNTGQTAQDATFTDDLTAVLDDADYQNDASSTVGQTGYAAPKLTWNGKLGIGESATITYSVKVKNPNPGDHTLSNVVTSDTPGNNCPPGSTDPKCTTTTPVSGLEIEKAVDKQSANPGDTVTYTVTVRNTGKTKLTAATFTDDLTTVLDDADYQNDAAANPGSVSYAAPKLTWTGDVEIGASATVTYSVKVKNPNPGDHRLSNVVTSETPGNNCPPGSTDPKCTTTTPVSGLVIKKTSDKQTVKPGDTVTYTVTVHNTGQTPQDNATFTDDLTKVLDDADYQNDASASTGSVTYAAPKLTWTGKLAIGESATVTYTVKVKIPNPGDKQLDNVVTSDTPGNNCPPGSTDPNCSTHVPGPELTAKKQADKQTANPGDVVTYTVTVTNTGQLDLTGATVTDDLSGVLDDADYRNDASASPIAGAFTFTSPTLTWRGDLKIGQSTTLTYSVTVHNPITGDHQLRNAVATDQPGTCPPESTDPDCTTVTPLPGIAIEKAADKQSANPGDTVTYTVTVRNTGKTKLTAATFTDDLTTVLDDADYQNDASASAGSVTYAAPKLTWIGDLELGATATVTYSVKVKNPNPGDRRLSNVVTSDTPGNNCPPGSTDPKCTTTTPVSGLEIEKVVDKQSANPGDTVKYTVTVRNNGQTPYQGATFTDDFTKVLDDADYQNDASASAGAVTYAAPRLTWTGDLAIGASATITYSVKVKNPNPGDHRLSNVVTSETPGNNCPPGSTDPKCTTTTPVSGLIIKKTSDKRTAKPGDKVGYRVLVTNTGQTTQNATFTDDLTQVLDDATYNTDAAATAGSVTYAAPKLTWTGTLAAGASVTVTYSVTVAAPPKGDGKLRNVVTSDTPGNNCPPDSTDPDCTTTTPVTNLEIVKTSGKQTARAGDVVTYRVEIRNTGQAPLTAVRVVDDLRDVIDNATYNGDARATLGAVTYAAPTLTWLGDLPVGAIAVLTYSVTTRAGSGKLRNVVTSDTPGNNCPPGSTDPRCTTDTPLIPLTPPPIAYTGAPVQLPAVLGTVFLLAGALLLLITRRRRPE